MEGVWFGAAGHILPLFARIWSLILLTRPRLLPLDYRVDNLWEIH